MFLTKQETADYLNISKKQVERLCKDESFPCPYSFGKKAYRFNKDEIDNWIKTRKAPASTDVKVIPMSKIAKKKPLKTLDTKGIKDFLQNHHNRGGLTNGTAATI